MLSPDVDSRTSGGGGGPGRRGAGTGVGREKHGEEHGKMPAVGVEILQRAGRFCVRDRAGGEGVG